MTSPTSPTIRADCGDSELSDAVAKHVAGWYRMPDGYGVTDVYAESRAGGRIIGKVEDNRFATDANAVLPLLEKHSVLANYQRMAKPPSGEVLITTGFQTLSGIAPTFCHAACFALLRANGVTVVE